MVRNLFICVSKLQSYSVDALTNRKNFRANFVKVAILFRIWGIAAIVSFLAIMVIYTLFFGRNKIVLDETIYENYRFVGQPGAFQLATGEGYGLTSYGQNCLIVNKTLDPTVFRVLFIGDSYVKAKHVSDDKKFTEIVEQVWNRTHPDSPIQTLNLGLGGQDIRTYLSFGNNMDEHFHPELVFLMISKHDFRFLAKDPKKLEMVAQGLTEPIIKPEKSSVFQDFINQLGFRSFFGQLQSQTFGFLSQGKGVDEVEAAEEKFLLLNNETAAAIQLKGLKEIWGGRLVIIYRTFTPEDTFIHEMKKQEIPVINLYQPFRMAFQERKPPKGFNNSILGKGHLNHYGHQLVAEEIVKFLEETKAAFDKPDD